MSYVVLGVGSNIGDRIGYLRFAVDALNLVPGVRVVSASRVYETEPVGYADQSDFLNAVLLLETERSAESVLGMCLGIEAAAGRIRTIKNGPRVLDLDVLLYEGVRKDTPELRIPHPAMGERAFVLKPLSDLFPDGTALGFRFGELLSASDTSGVRKTEYTLLEE